MLISKEDGGKYMARHGQIPVAFLTFYDIGAQPDMFNSETVLRNIQDSIRLMCEDHIYLSNILFHQTTKFEGPNTQAHRDMHTFERLSNDFNKENPTATQNDLEMSIYFLTRLLHTHFKRKVLLLIDDYDAPINSSIGKPYYSYVKGTMNQIYLKGIKRNDHVEKVVMIGTLPLAQSRLLSLNAIESYSISNDTRYSKHFGFTESEVKQLLIENLCKPYDIDKVLEHIKLWFDGY